MLSCLLWQPDKWQRLGTVADLAGPTSSILDVGGRGREMLRVAATRHVISVNVEEPCDLLVSAGPLPFAKGAFETTVSCDVLEHLPSSERGAHVAELVRVARRRVVICFPCGSEAKDASERRLADHLLHEYDVRFEFLDEHLTHGLPRTEDVLTMVRAVAPDASLRVLFQDGVEEAERMLRDAVEVWKTRRPSAFFRSAGAWLERRPPRLVEQVSADNNRAYLVIDVSRR